MQRNVPEKKQLVYNKEYKIVTEIPNFLTVLDVHCLKIKWKFTVLLRENKSKVMGGNDLCTEPTDAAVHSLPNCILYALGVSRAKQK